jgi:hypothetical protein
MSLHCRFKPGFGKLQLRLPLLPALTCLNFAGQKLEGSAALPEALTTMTSLRVTCCCTSMTVLDSVIRASALLMVPALTAWQASF